MTRRPIATRCGEPAYINAPPRLRQSDIDKKRDQERKVSQQ